MSNNFCYCIKTNTTNTSKRGKANVNCVSAGEISLLWTVFQD